MKNWNLILDTYFWDKVSKTKNINFNELNFLENLTIKWNFIWLKRDYKKITEDLIVNLPWQKYSFYIKNYYNSVYWNSSFEIIIIDDINKIVLSKEEYQKITWFSQEIVDIENNCISTYTN